MWIFTISNYYLHIMSEEAPKIADDHIRCTKCSKLVAKALPSGHFEVKCLRCGTFNELIDGGGSNS